MAHMNSVAPRNDADEEEEVLIHPELVERARTRLLDGPPIDAVARQFALMADPTRLHLLIALSVGELCVHDLAAASGVNRSTVSHQLRTLREARLVRRRKAGKISYYALDDDHVVNLIALATEHLQEPEAGEPA